MRIGGVKLKKIIRILLALILSFVIISFSDYVISVVTPTLDEKSVASFNKNKEKFEKVKDYVLTKNENFRLTYEDYTAQVLDENVKSEIEFIFTKMNTSSVVLKNGDVVFYCSSSQPAFSFKIVYKNTDNDFSGYSELGGNWYYRSHIQVGGVAFFTPYNPKVKFFLFIGFIILTFCFYLIFGKISYFKNAKN